MSKLLKGFLGIYKTIGSNNKLMLYDDHLEINEIYLLYNQINDVTLSKASIFTYGHIRISLKEGETSKLNILREYTVFSEYTIYFDRVRNDSAEEIKKLIDTKITPNNNYAWGDNFL